MTDGRVAAEMGQTSDIVPVRDSTRTDGLSRSLGPRLALGLSSLRLVVMFLILLDTLSGAIATLIEPVDLSSLRDIGLGLLAACIAAALLWSRNLVAGLLCLVMVVLTLTFGPSGDDTTVLFLLGVLTPNRFSRPRQWLIGAAVLGYAVAFGLHQEAAHPGWGWPAALTTVVAAAVGFGIGLAARRLLRTEERRRTRVRRLEIENAQIRTQERNRLADELQVVVTKGLAQLEAEVRAISVSPDPPGRPELSEPAERPTGSGEVTRLNAGLALIDDASRQLLTQLRSLLGVLRRELPATAKASPDVDRTASRLARLVSVRNVRVLAMSVFGVLAVLVVVFDHPMGLPAHWLKLATIVACGIALWRPRGTRVGAVMDALVLVVTVLSQDASGWDALAVATLSLILTARFGLRRAWLVVLGVLAYDGLRWLLAPTTPAGYVLVGYGGALGLLLGLAVHSYLQARAESEVRMDDLLGQRERLETDERNALARELHDVVAHQLSVTTMIVMATAGSTELEPLRRAVSRIANCSLAARLELDVLLHMMRGVAADQAEAPPLVSPIAIGRALERQLRETGHAPDVDLDPAADRLDPTSQRTLARIIQESTTNIIRYAPVGSPCVFRLRVEDERVELRVVSPLTTRERRSPLSLGYGLRGIRERVELTHGTFEAGPTGDTWEVRVTLPRSTDDVTDRVGATPGAR